MLRPSPPPTDLLLALALTVAGQAELWLRADQVDGPLAVHAAALAVASAALAWRRALPLVTAVVVVGAVAAQTVFGGTAPVVSSFLAAIVAVYSVAAYAEPRDAALGAAVTAIALTSNLANAGEEWLGDLVGNYVVFGAIWILGWALGNRRRHARALEKRAARLEEEHQAETRATLAAERGRIARELHDVVAHTLGVMVVQAGAARQVLDRDPRAAMGALLAIEDKGREALDEMRRLLGILRTDTEELDLSPQPGLADLDRLADRMQQAGLEVEVEIEGDRDALPAGLELAVFRIVQESLTNALKHAGPTQARVKVRLDARMVLVDVTDAGPARTADRRPVLGAGGHGLMGLRERAAVYGGTLEAGPLSSGGFSVRARLPRHGHPA